MGFFSKIGKGIKSAFKSIGRGIKSAFKRFGKFMSKIGVLGQVALMFILPGVGNMIASAWSGIAGQTAAQVAASTAGQATASAAASAGATTAAATTAGANTAGKIAETIAKGTAKGATKIQASLAKAALGSSKATGLMAGGNFAQGVGKLMQFTGKVVGTPGRVFSNITQGVTDTLGNFAKTASNNIFGTKFTTAAGNSLNGKFFGAGDSAFGRSFGDTSKFANVLAKSPTIATKQAASNFQAGLTGPPAIAGQGPLKTPKFQVKESDMYKLPDGQDLMPKGAFDNLESGMTPGGKLDLSQPIKDIDTAQYNTNEFGGNQVADTAGRTGSGTGIAGPDGKRGGKSFLEGEKFTPLESMDSQIPDSMQDTMKNMFRQDDGTIDFSKKRGVMTTKNVNYVSEIGGDVVPKTLQGLDLPPLEIPKTPSSLLSAQPTPADPSFFDKLKTGITDIPTRIKDKATDIAKDPLGYAFKGFEESLQQGMQYKAKEALGLTPDMPDQYVTNTRAYVPSFDTGGGAGSYQAPETMDARAFEQNVLAAPSQYGYTAFQYDQYMNRTAQA